MRFTNSGRKLHGVLVGSAAAAIALVVASSGARFMAAAEPTSPAGVDQAAVDRAVNRAVDYFRQVQANDGSFSGHTGPAVTAIVTAGLLQNGRSVNEPMVARALEYLESHVQEDGGVYLLGSRYHNYESCLAILAFHAANIDGRYDDVLAGAEQFVRRHQWDEEEGHDISSMHYGGAGYGTHTRPDLSNTTFLVEALTTLGAGEDDPAIQKALVFISRSQNLESEHNQTPFAAKVNDGGFYYTPAAGGVSMAGETPDGGLRSYGSMTYAGLKSMIYAGLTPEDPRVQAAYEWIQRHYTVEENPGMGPQGLFYYYQTFAKALGTLGHEELVDADGQPHDWRADLARQLIAAQQDDGSWVNEHPRWLEGDPNLVTGYSLLALAYCRAE